MSRPAKLIPLTDPQQIPDPMTEAEARTFWDAHEVTETFLQRAEQTDDLPAPRAPTASQSINVRLETSTLKRLKTLAAHKQVGYQTLLKSFVTERLYEEEKREGLLE